MVKTRYDSEEYPESIANEKANIWTKRYREYNTAIRVSSGMFVVTNKYHPGVVDSVSKFVNKHKELR